MKGRPIIFNGHMVRAILSGRKTQTRRVMIEPPDKFTHIDFDEKQGWHWWWNVERHYTDHSDVEREYRPINCPHGKPGGQLWVREKFALYQTVNHIRRSDGRASDEISDGLIGYCADGFDTIEDFREHIRQMSGADLEAVVIDGDRWKPSIHMPRWASRINLEVVSVRVESVQDITEEDAKAEGVDGGCLNCGESSAEQSCGCDRPEPNYRDAFSGLWDSINAKRGYDWASNPWVWVVEFKREVQGGLCKGKQRNRPFL